VLAQDKSIDCGDRCCAKEQDTHASAFIQDDRKQRKQAQSDVPRAKCLHEGQTRTFAKRNAKSARSRCWRQYRADTNSEERDRGEQRNPNQRGYGNSRIAELEVIASNPSPGDNLDGTKHGTIRTFAVGQEMKN
jgi:hypothetical protein